jgi:glycerophosphoryl diester phosphodiesterase
VFLVAHRTPSTRAACERVAAAGAQVFEADIQIDDDDRLVVSHFFPLGRLLQRDNWRIRWHTGAARDPRIADVDALVPRGATILLDLKETDQERRARLVSAIVESLSDRERFRACTGNPDDLAELRQAGFRTWRTVGSRRQLGVVLSGAALTDEAVTVRHSLLTADVLDQLRELTRTVVAWTVNDPARARRLRDLGVDGVTTDRMAVLHALNSSD